MKCIYSIKIISVLLLLFMGIHSGTTQEIVPPLNTSKFNKPLTTTRMFHPDSIIKSGRWGTALNIRETKSFDKFKTSYMEPGIIWTNGMFTTPGNAPTEMIYYHDGSDLFLSGYVSVLDCIDYCGGVGDCGFIIVGDGKELWNSGVVKHHDKPVKFNVSLKGIKELRLIVNSGGDNIDEDWGCWMDMNISKKQGKPDTVNLVKDDNILINGSFEEGFAPGTFKTLKTGDKIPGWTVTKATVDLSGNYLKAQDGKNSIDLNGTPGFGGIQQRFFTEKGKKYLLSFYLAGNPAGGPRIKKLLVSFGDQTRELEFDVTGKTVNNMGWEYHEFIFKAKDRATILKFESNHTSGPTNWGPTIDNVKLVPYHKSIPLLGFKSGFLGGASYYFVSESNIYPFTGYDRSRYKLTLNNNAIAYHFGLFSQMRIWHIFVQPELYINYITADIKIQDLYDSFPDTTGTLNHFYLDIPVVLGYKEGVFSFMAGPVWHYFITDRSKLPDNISKNLRKLTIGYQIGIGFVIKNVGIGLRYEGNARKLGAGLQYSGKRIYFADTPGQIIATLYYSF